VLDRLRYDKDKKKKNKTNSHVDLGSSLYVDEDTWVWKPRKEDNAIDLGEDEIVFEPEEASLLIIPATMATGAGNMEAGEWRTLVTGKKKQRSTSVGARTTRVQRPKKSTIKGAEYDQQMAKSKAKTDVEPGKKVRGKGDSVTRSTEDTMRIKPPTEKKEGEKSQLEGETQQPETEVGRNEEDFVPSEYSGFLVQQGKEDETISRNEPFVVETGGPVDLVEGGGSSSVGEAAVKESLANLTKHLEEATKRTKTLIHHDDTGKIQEIYRKIKEKLELQLLLDIFKRDQKIELKTKERIDQEARIFTEWAEQEVQKRSIIVVPEDFETDLNRSLPELQAQTPIEENLVGGEEQEVEVNEFPNQGSSQERMDDMFPSPPPLQHFPPVQMESPPQQIEVEGGEIEIAEQPEMGRDDCINHPAIEVSYKEEWHKPKEPLTPSLAAVVKNPFPGAIEPALHFDKWYLRKQEPVFEEQSSLERLVGSHEMDLETANAEEKILQEKKSAEAIRTREARKRLLLEMSEQGTGCEALDAEVREQLETIYEVDEKSSRKADPDGTNVTESRSSRDTDRTEDSEEIVFTQRTTLYSEEDQDVRCIDVDRVSYRGPNYCHNIIMTQGDLFESVEALGQAVSADMHMGAGIAYDFKREFGGIQELFMQKILPGGVAVLERDVEIDGIMKTRFIYNLVTKVRYRDKPVMEDLKESLCSMRRHATLNNVNMICLPRIGAGLDGLVWREVYAAIADVFGGSNIHIRIFMLPKVAIRAIRKEMDELVSEDMDFTGEMVKYGIWCEHDGEEPEFLLHMVA
jgi:O-acetyl-ADP-ribose deacetylase (regulator of RNase III)